MCETAVTFYGLGARRGLPILEEATNIAARDRFKERERENW